MSNKPIEMRKIKRIYKFDSQGLSHRKISVQLGVSRPTIKKYLEQIKKYELTLEEVELMSIEELSQLFGQLKKEDSRKLKVLKKYFPHFDKELKKTGVTRKFLWEEYISKHPDGLKLSQFSYWYKQWCLAVSPVMHFNHKAGDKLFIDYTGKKLQVIDPSTGEVKQAEVILCVLGSSQMTYVEATYTQRKEDFIKSIENSLWFFKGVPRALVTDNLKAAVKKSSKYEPVLNETFSDFADYYQTTVLPTRAYKPRDKAIVENAVKIIYTRVFAKLRTQTFHTLESLNKAILEHLEKHNNMSFRGRSYSRKDIYEQTELESLNPLPLERYEIKHIQMGTVHKNSHVYLKRDKHYYSVPYRYISQKARIISSSTVVQIYIKQEYVASHVRNEQAYGYSTKSDHMPSQHQFVSEWSSKKFIEWATSIGPFCKEYIEKVLDKKQHPEQSYKSCAGILHMTKKVGKDRLEKACKRALEYDAYNYSTLRRILEKGWEEQNESPQQNNEIPQHQNIRGNDYYK